MSAREPEALDPRRRELIGAALSEDPALAEELELIASQLSDAAAGRFWEAFADGCAAGGRPAAAVLPALEKASGVGVEGRAPGRRD